MTRPLARLLVLASFIFALPLGAENLLTNPGFDSDLSAWPIAGYPGLTVRWDSRDARSDRTSGSLLLHFDGLERTASLSRVSQTIPVTPNAEYSFGAKIRQVDNPAGATAFVAMFWKRADGFELYRGETAVVAINGAWVATSARAVAPDEAAFVQVRLYIREVKGTTVLFDDVFVERITDGACPVDCGGSVAEGAPTGTPAAFSVAFQSGCMSQPDVLWDFGDGTTSSVPNAIHVYGSDGVYRWTLSRFIGEHSCLRTGTITVASVPLISFFTAAPSSVQSLEPVLLSWSTTGATSVSIDGGIGTVAASGTLTVHPRSSGLYTLTATNSAGSSTARVSIEVSGSRRRAVRR